MIIAGFVAGIINIVRKLIGLTDVDSSEFVLFHVRACRIDRVSSGRPDRDTCARTGNIWDASQNYSASHNSLCSFRFQYKDTLLQSGLAPVVEAIEDREGDAPLSTLPQLDGRSIANAMSKLDTFLCSVSMEISPTLAKITSSRLAGSITQRASKMLVETYKSVYEQIVDPANGVCIDFV